MNIPYILVPEAVKLGYTNKKPPKEEPREASERILVPESREIVIGLYHYWFYYSCSQAAGIIRRRPTIDVRNLPKTTQLKSEGP